MLEFYQNPNINNGLTQNTHDNRFTTTLECNGRTDDIGTIKCEEKNFEICKGCGQKIQDRYFMKFCESSWHEQCLLCCECGMTLNLRCYFKDMKIYCKNDYDRLFRAKCDRCGDPITSTEMVMKVRNFNFHLNCFVCWICGQRLQKGDQYILRSRRLFCKHHIENEFYLSQHYTSDDYLIEDTIRHKDGRRGPKRPRTILTSAQRRQFKASFEVSPKPCRKIREALAKDTGLSVRVVQVWFQNQRAKMKKIQRKAKQDGDKGGDKDKDDKIKRESPNSEHGLYLGLDGSYNSSSQPLNPNMPYSPDDYPTNSNDSFCSSDDSLDGSQFDNLDDATSDTLSLQNLELHTQNHSHHHHHHNHHSHNNNNHNNNQSNNSSHENLCHSLAGSIINPIDKLYLMQNSYFNTEQ